jgi:hypothetical protein
VLRVERELRERLDRLSERLHESRTALGVSPERLQRAVRVGLELARQPGLTPGTLDRPHPAETVWAMPALTGGWARAAIGVADPLTGKPRPITFDETVADGHDDIVYVHLGHRLVQQCLLRMRAEIWATGGPGDMAGRTGRRTGLARVTARLVPDLASEGPAVVSHGRLVVTGADGHRLHEEMISAGGTISEGRFRRLNLGEVDQLLAAGGDGMPGAVMRERLAGLWPQLAGPLTAALEQRAQDRAASLTRVLVRRAATESESVAEVLQELRRSIEASLHEPEIEQLSLFEREQLHRDVDALRRRLARIPEDIAAEQAMITRRYADPTPRLFPAAVTFLVPHHLVDS